MSGNTPLVLIVNHHPDVTLTYPWVGLRLWSHDAAGLTQRDIDLARRISEIAREQGVVVAQQGFQPDVRGVNPNVANWSVR